HIRRANERAFEIVAPVMIRAQQDRPSAARSLIDGRATMATGIVECVELPILGTANDDRRASDLGRHDSPGVRQLAFERHEMPLTLGDDLHVEAKYIWLIIERLVERMPGLLSGKQVCNFLPLVPTPGRARKNVHDSFPVPKHRFVATRRSHIFW